MIELRWLVRQFHEERLVGSVFGGADKVAAYREVKVLQYRTKDVSDFGEFAWSEWKDVPEVNDE